MEKNKTLNKLEKIQKELTKFEFIKSYPVLNKIFTSNGEIRLIELILSYQDNDKVFYMDYDMIGELLFLKTQSVKNIVYRLNKLKVITSTNSKNYDGTKGGSSSTLFVNLDVIIKMIKELPIKPTPEAPKSEPKEVTKSVEVTIPEVEIDGLDSLFDNTLPEIKDENIVRKSFNKLLQLEMVENEYNNGSINTGQLVDLKEKIENNKYIYKEEIQSDLDEEINYNIMSKLF